MAIWLHVHVQKKHTHSAVRASGPTPLSGSWKPDPTPAPRPYGNRTPPKTPPENHSPQEPVGRHPNPHHGPALPLRPHLGDATPTGPPHGMPTPIAYGVGVRQEGIHQPSDLRHGEGDNAGRFAPLQFPGPRPWAARAAKKGTGKHGQDDAPKPARTPTDLLLVQTTPAPRSPAAFLNHPPPTVGAGTGPGGSGSTMWRQKPMGLCPGKPDGCGDAFYAAVKAQQDKELVTRGPAGQRWNVRDEDEATRRLPRLSVMFPLSADS